MPVRKDTMQDPRMKRVTAWTAVLAIAAALAAGMEPPAGAAASAPAIGSTDWADHPVNTWVKQSPREGAPATPRPFQYEGGAAYDPASRKLFHHGGHEGIYQTERTFAYDLGSGRWEQRFPNTSPPGACCLNNNGLAFDVANRRLVRFGGASLSHGFQMSRSVYLKYAPTPVWTYDPAANRWTAVRPPPYAAPGRNSRTGTVGVACAVSAYDPAHEVVVHLSSGRAFVYDAYANALDTLPAKRPENAAHGMAVDPKANRVIIFGGGTGSDERTWVWTVAKNEWSALDLKPRPPATAEDPKTGYSTHPVMAYDSLNHVMLCVIWHPKDQTHETWGLELTPEPKWTKMNPPAEPTPGSSRGRNLAYSQEHNVFILELAPASGRTPNEIWTYRFKHPAPDPRPQPPADLEVVTEPGRATLRWTPSPAPAVKQYRVYRAEAEKPWQAEYALLGTTEGTTFADTKVAGGKVYFYKVAALGADGAESALSAGARTQPRVLANPVVSVLAANRVTVTWNPHPAKDVVDYNVYRGLVTVRAVKQGKPAPWTDNDPEYPEPLVCHVLDITGIVKLNEVPVAGTTWTDTKVDLSAKGPESGDYRYAVYAYIVRAVNRLGVESGPSPYALTIPSAPMNVLVRNTPDGWEAKWDANPEQGIAGYRVYRTQGTHVHSAVTPHAEPPIKTPFFKGRGDGRVWVTAVDTLGQEGEPSSPANVRASYPGFFEGEWHQ